MRTSSPTKIGRNMILIGSSLQAALKFKWLEFAEFSRLWLAQLPRILTNFKSNRSCKNWPWKPARLPTFEAQSFYIILMAMWRWLVCSSLSHRSENWASAVMPGKPSNELLANTTFRFPLPTFNLCISFSGTESWWKKLTKRPFKYHQSLS